MAQHQENYLQQDKQEKDLLFEIREQLTVIEGCDSNGCEYMTGGTVVISR